MFGREYVDNTPKDLLALPLGREVIVVAKFVVVAGWSMLLVALVVIEAFGLGNLLQLDGGRLTLGWQTAVTIAFVASLTVLLITHSVWSRVFGADIWRRLA